MYSLELPDAPFQVAAERLRLVHACLCTLQLSRGLLEYHEIAAHVLRQWLPLLDREDCDDAQKSYAEHLLAHIMVRQAFRTTKA